MYDAAHQDLQLFDLKMVLRQVHVGNCHQHLDNIVR